MHFVRNLALIPLLIAAGCGTASLEDELIGAWYGEEGPDDDQCFVFCGDGRLFTGDRPCDDSDAGDFAISYPIDFADDSFSVSFDGRDAVVFTDVSVSGDTLNYGFAGRSFQAMRTRVPDYCSTRP
ncbi:MAG: hypothetical protein AB8H86_12425 [Polyangiales bacterium]